MIDARDMILLIETEDALNDMDQTLEQLAGHGHASGDFIKLDNVFDVIYHNSHTVFAENSEKGQEMFFQILINRKLTPKERAEILMNGLVSL